MMKKINTIRRLIGAGVIGVVPFALSASAQTTTSTQPATTTTVKKPTSATSQMIDEAIQRSQARSAKARTLGVPEQWGSEEPFTYVPGKTY
jgi:hypothetical protein